MTEKSQAPRTTSFPQGTVAAGPLTETVGVRAAFLSLSAESAFMCAIGANVGSRVAIPVSSMLTNSGVITETVHGRIRAPIFLVSKVACGRLASCRTGRSEDPPQASRSWCLMNVQGDPITLRGMQHEHVQRVGGAEAGQVTLGASCTAWTPRTVFMYCAGEQGLGGVHIQIRCVFVGVPKALV